MQLKRHDFIVNTLVRLGFRTSLRGFEQFCACVEDFSDHRSATIDSIYVDVALQFNCTKSAVEKNLRRLFYSSDACAAMGRLFGAHFSESGNKEIVAMFSSYVGLHRAEYAD